MKRRITFLCGIITLLLSGGIAVAQENAKVNLRLEARGDYQYENVAEHTVESSTGFRGKNLNLRLDGNITEAWSYSYRQRLAKPNGDASYFDAVDWIHLTYTTGAWDFSGGKQVVAVGGYEYDRAPIDFYFGSEYWNNMPCYQWGVSASYTFGDEANNALKLQVTQSPFSNTMNPGSTYSRKDFYAYNLMWTGAYGWIDLLHSVNVMEYARGKYIGYLTLGHQLNMGAFKLQLDWMSRTDMEKLSIIKDFSVMADLSWAATKKLNVFGKATYDVNKDNVTDLCVLPGTELTRVGGGVEYFPLKDSRAIRLHANYSYAWDKACDTQSFASVGVTWKVNVFNR